MSKHRCNRDFFTSLKLSTLLHSLLIILIAGPVSCDPESLSLGTQQGQESLNEKDLGVPVEVEIIPREALPDVSETPQEEDCENWFGGIGVELTFDGRITQVYAGYPASRAGIQVGDELVFSESDSPIVGDLGTDVKLTFKRNNISNTYIITRGKICIEEKKE